MRRLLPLLVVLFTTVSAMAYEVTGTFNSLLYGMFSYSGETTIRITPNGDNYDVVVPVFASTPFGNMGPIEMAADNVPLVDGKLSADFTREGYGILNIVIELKNDKTIATGNGDLDEGMSFTFDFEGPAIDITSAINTVSTSYEENSYKYIENGKIVVVKDGKQYNHNGTLR